MSSPIHSQADACARCGAALGPEGHCQSCAPSAPPAEAPGVSPAPSEAPRSQGARERLRAAWARLLKPASLLTALLCVDGAFAAVRLLQVAFPVEVPRVLHAWLLAPLLWDVPLDARPVAACLALVPWVLWGVSHLLHVELLRATGGQGALSRRQVLALTWVPGYSLVGLPRLLGALARALPRRATALTRGASGLLVLMGAVAAALVLEVMTDAPVWSLGVLASDGVLLCAQFLVLRTAYVALREHVREPPTLELLADEVVPEALPALQDAGFDCPECPAPAPLQREVERLGASCGRCEGSLLTARERDQVMAEVGVTEAALRQLMAEAAGRQVRCASCGGAAITVVLRGAAVSPCAACGTMWTRAGVLHQLSQGRHGRVRARPASVPKRREPVVLSPLASAGALAGLVVGGVGLALLLSDLAPCPAGSRIQRQAREHGWVLHQCVAANGKPEGPSFLRDARGRLRERDEWVTGERAGPRRRWDASGRLRWEGEYQRGLRSGTWRSFDEAGTPRVQLSFSADKLQGEAVELTEAGTPWERRTYEAGVLKGPYALFFANGRKRVEGTYDQGQRSGDWTLYDEAGQRVDAAWWSQGKRSVVVVDGDGGGEGARAEPDGATTSGDAVTKAPAVDALYAGHPLEWWAQRLRLLWPQRQNPEGEARYALTVRRAGLHGLRVEETTAGPRVSLPSQATEAQAREELP